MNTTTTVAHGLAEQTAMVLRIFPDSKVVSVESIRRQPSRPPAWPARKRPGG